MKPKSIDLYAEPLPASDLFGGRVRDICVCHLPYQHAPFVVGTIDNSESETGESNVWLKRDGTWSQIDGDPECSLSMGGWNPPN